MLAKCCSPSCENSFRFLPEGTLFRLENDLVAKQSAPTNEYFWSCSGCSETMTLGISDEGRVMSGRMPETIRDGDLVIRKRGLLLSEVSL
jgi:hypothetical protein